MTSSPRIRIEADLGKKAVEKTDVYVYQDGKLIETHFDMSYDDIRQIAEEFKRRYKDAEIETCCTGEDCAGGFHRWLIDT
jgi:hypothetical protein